MRLSKQCFLLGILCSLVLAELQSGSNNQGAKFELLPLGQQQQINLGNGEVKYLSFKLTDQKVSSMIIDISSSGQFNLCYLDLNKRCVSDMQTIYKMQNSLRVKREEVQFGMKIVNPSDQANVTIKITFHFDNEACHILESQVLHRKKLSHSNCFMFSLNKEEDMLLLISRQSFMNLEYQFSLCGANVKTNIRPDQNEFLFKKAQIKQLCKSVQSKNLTVTIIDRSSSANKKLAETAEGSNVELVIALQYAASPILLPDGLAYTTDGMLAEDKRYFQFQVLNKQNISINVITEAQVQIYAKLVEFDKKDIVVPGKDNFDFSSKSGFIFTYFKSYLVITQEQLNKFDCKQCYLLVVVSTSEAAGFQLSIQITQKMSVLTNGEIKHHFLQGGSMAYYQYTPKIDTLVSYQLSDNNKNCAIFYLSTSELPGPLNKIQASQGNRIIHKSTSNTVYYIGVQASSDCTYSLVATDSSNQIVKLQKGHYGFLNMAKGQVKYFFIKTGESEFIKLLSLHVYGKVEIYINRTQSTGIKGFQPTLGEYLNFTMKGQYMNRLILEKSNKLYCDNCYYLVAVVASKITESTLFYGDQDTPIPIHDKVINDMIPSKGGKVNGQYFGQLKFDLQVKIHSGKLKLKIKNGDRFFQSDYQEAEVVSTSVVDLGEKKSLFQILASLFNYSPTTVIFQALEDNTVYSVKFIDNQGDSSDYQDDKESSASKISSQKPHNKGKTVSLQAGQSTYFSLQSNENTCLCGFFSDKAEKILISSWVDEKDKLYTLSFSFLADGRTLDLETQIIQNIMTLSIPSLASYHISKGINYTLCISTNSSDMFWLTAMQSEDFALLPSEVDSIVRGEYTFVTHTQSPLIVDIFSCRGKSQIVYDQNRQKLNQNNSKMLDIIGLSNQPHAVRINKFSTTFYKITAPLAIVRWFPFQIEQGVGTGYIDYAIGKLRYESGVFGITLVWESLSEARDTNSTLDSVSFTLYVSTSSSDLQSGSQCQTFLESDTWQVQNIVDPISAKKLSSVFSHTFSKGELVDRFGQNTTLYSTVVVDVTLSPQGDGDQEIDEQRYRFIYAQVQIPGEIISNGYFSAMSFTQIIFVALFGLLVVAIIIYLLLRKILPLLGILKNRFLVEEGEPQVSEPIENKVASEGHQDDLIVPPSSQRNGVERFNEMMGQFDQEEQNK